MPAQLREAVPADSRALGDLAVAFYAEEQLPAEEPVVRDAAARLVEHPEVRVAVAEDPEGEVVAFCMTWFVIGLEQGAYVEVGDLYVAPRARGGGLARALLEDAFAWGRSRGALTAELHIDDQGDERHDLAGFYARFGFGDMGRRVLTRPL